VARHVNLVYSAALRKTGDPCATFVWAAFKSVGVDLTAHTHAANRWVFPRDFQSSPLTVEVLIPNQNLCVANLANCPCGFRLM